MCLVFGSYIQLKFLHIFIKILHCIVAVWYDNKFKSVRIATDTLTLWTITGSIGKDIIN